MLELACHIIEQKADHFKPEKFKDRYETSVVELLRKKEAGERIERRETPRPSNVINLMDALRRSVATQRGQKAPTRANERGTVRSAPKRAPPRRASSRTRTRKAG